MKNNNRKIVPYLRGELRNQEKAAFEQDLQKDTSFKQEVEFYQDLSKVVNWKGAMEEAQEELSGQQHTPAKVRTLGMRRLLSYAASFLVLLTCGTLWFANTNYSDTALANLNESKLNLYNSSNNRTVENQQTQTRQEGITALEEHRYTDAIQFFDAIATENPSDFSAQLSSAYAAYKAGNYSIAEETAAKMAKQTQDKLVQQKAEWLIVQSKLAYQGQDENLSTFLQKIVRDDTHLFQKEAKKLEIKRNSFWRKFLL